MPDQKEQSTVRPAPIEAIRGAEAAWLEILRRNHPGVSFAYTDDRTAHPGALGQFPAITEATRLTQPTDYPLEASR